MAKSKNGGVSTTDIEVTSISRHGFWLYLGGRELFMSFREFPWFEDAPAKRSQMYGGQRRRAFRSSFSRENHTQANFSLQETRPRHHAMNAGSHSSRFTPEGWRTVTPRIVALDAQELVAFIKSVFGATGEYRPDRPAVLNIGDSMIMISEAGIREPSLEEPSDTPYGDVAE
jgi:hypothetical protein